MTIKDALDRAKLLRKARDEERRVAAREDVSLAQVGHELREPSDEAESAQPPAPPPMFRIAEISDQACQKNRILVSDSQLAEFRNAETAYRMLRSRVQQRLRRGRWSTLAVTSPGKDDGKTVTVLNLALSIAREKQRKVYALDLDMRNPSFCRYLGLHDIRCLSDYFRGEASAEEVLVQTSLSDLVVAGALSPVANASEMLAGPRFDDLLRQARAWSPDALVIIDLPPVRLSDEAVVVAPRVDALLMVVCEGKTPRDELTRALGVLGDYNVAGVVVNRSSDPHVASYDHYYG